MIENISKTRTANPLSDIQVKPIESTPRIKEAVPEVKEKSRNPQDQSSNQQDPSREKMETVIASMNGFLKASNTHLKFYFHDELQKYYVAIVDDQTDEVVKEIPPKKLLDMYAAMTDYLGLLVDKKI
jgi:flagellar protein FlaG